MLLTWPPFSTEGSLPLAALSAGINKLLYALASPDRWEGHEANQAAHGGSQGWKIHSLLGLVLIKANGCKRFSEGLLLCHGRGWKGSRISPQPPGLAARLFPTWSLPGPRSRGASHVGSLPLQPRVVGSGNRVPGVHVPVHAHGDALLRDREPSAVAPGVGWRVARGSPRLPGLAHLLRVVERAAGLPDALPKALVRHALRREGVRGAAGPGRGQPPRRAGPAAPAAIASPRPRTAEGRQQGRAPPGRRAAHPPPPVSAPPDLQELLCVGHGDLHLHLLHDEPRVQLPATATPGAEVGAEVGAEAALHAAKSPRAAAPTLPAKWRLAGTTAPSVHRARRAGRPPARLAAPRVHRAALPSAAGGGVLGPMVSPQRSRSRSRGWAGVPGGRPARRGAPRLHPRRPGTPPGRGQRPMSRVGMSFGVTSGCGGGGPGEDGKSWGGKRACRACSGSAPGQLWGGWFPGRPSNSPASCCPAV